MKFRLLIIIFSFSLSRVFATEQEPDKIIIDKIEYDLLSRPLDYFLAKNQIISEKLYNLGTSKYGAREISTGNYRGYIATFKIEHQLLKLIDIKIPNIESENRENISVYKQLFGNKDIILNYSGILIIPTEEFLDSANFGYSYLYSKYKLITINNSEVIKEKNVSKDEYLKFKINQFTEYKNTNQYKTEVREYFENWKDDKKIELSRSNTKDLTKHEILELKKQYKDPPKIEMIDNFLFLTKNIDFVIVEY
ncbi:hypothetical protein NAL32_16295 [Chryseobacterium sp. Ch-15]|nr:hypothetical protein [Chryseobacterium muglaense]MCM2555947.1 hypothetical protein [Chryseobacterium muglaense]